jgi:hypothetical protein
MTAVLRCCSCLKHTKIRKADGELIKLYDFYEDVRDAVALCQKLKGFGTGFVEGNQL